MLGGSGFDSASEPGRLNDLWKYDPATGNWAWMKGASTADPSGTYGTLGTPVPANTPGGRNGAVSWATESGAFWVFGGEGFTPGWSALELNDLWRGVEHTTPSLAIVY